MKESIGMAWLMIIVMTFITLFSGYLAFSINYSKSFRVKDGIIERIHKYNGFVSDGSRNTLQDIDDFLANINYNARGDCYSLCHDSGNSFVGIRGTTVKDRDEETQGNSYNYCIVKVASKSLGDESLTADYPSVYYKVIVFFSLQIGQISLFSKFNTTGETHSLYFAQDSILFGEG
jgi:hypothetical protein